MLRHEVLVLMELIMIMLLAKQIISECDKFSADSTHHLTHVCQINIKSWTIIDHLVIDFTWAEIHILVEL